MKKYILLFLLCALFQGSKAIDLRPYSGAMYSRIWGFQTGIDVGITLKGNLYFMPGLMFYTSPIEHPVANSKRVSYNLPLYLGYRVPLNQSVSLDLNVGTYVGIGYGAQFGPALKAGVEVRKVYIGTNYMQNCVDNKTFLLGLTLGYRFEL